MGVINIIDLHIQTRRTDNVLVDKISFGLDEGKITGLVGESGSGKSLTAKSIMQLNPDELKTSGSIWFQKDKERFDLLSFSEKEMQTVRGNDIGMIFQDPMTSLSPSIRIGNQVMEALRIHNRVSKKDARKLSMQALEDVLLPDVQRIFNAYPFQLSGGQRQRVMIAMAIINKPKLIIADEATTALDVTVQKEILGLINRLREKYGIGILFITHDLSLLHNFANNMLVMQKGKIVEQGTTKQVLSAAIHPYTRGLLACRPEAAAKDHALPVIEDFVEGEKPKTQKRAMLQPTEKIILSSKDLNVWYKISKHRLTQALQNVQINIRQNETLGLVGESGCGKTTLSKSILQLLPYEGSIWFEDRVVDLRSWKNTKQFRTDVQFVFQDPYASLNPLHRIKTILVEPLIVHRIGRNNNERAQLVMQLMEKVGLDLAFLNNYPHQLSGGQRQRVAIARALAVNPKLLILDEAVAALDVSVQAKVLNLLNKLKAELGLTYLFISHDMSVVHYMSDRIVVMKDGEIVETGTSEQVMENPQSEYTKKLIAARP